MKIELEGKPIAKMRARHARRGGFVVTYDPQSDDKESVKKRLIAILEDAMNSANKQKALEACGLSRATSFQVDLWFYLPTNASDSERVRNAKLWGFIPATCKPDYDNLEKFYLDCANGILWPDDRMIVDAHAHKRFGEPARVEINVMAIEQFKVNKNAEEIFKIFRPLELDELLEKARMLGSMNIDYFYELEGKSREIWIEKTASLLSHFAEKYADKLKKVCKFNSDLVEAT